jgi:restriction system protein
MTKKSVVRSKLPSFVQLISATLRALSDLGGSGTIEEILDKVCEIESISEEVQRIPHKGSQRTYLSYRLAWARTYLRYYGAIENTDRGNWTITKKGLEISPAECAKIPSEVRRKNRLARKNRQKIEPNPLASEDEDEGEFQSEGSWRDELISTLKSISPGAFEKLAQLILREAGFTKVEVTGKSGDGGVDGIGILRVNLVSFTVLFQCKRYKNSVGSPEIRDFRGAMQGRCDKGLVITTGTFSGDARKEATRDGAPAIDLIDGEALCDLLKSLKLGVKTKLVEEVEVDSGWFRSV